MSDGTLHEICWGALPYALCHSNCAAQSYELPPAWGDPGDSDRYNFCRGIQPLFPGQRHLGKTVMKNKIDRRFSVSLDQETVEKIDLLAEKLKRPRSYAIRFIIKEYFDIDRSKRWLAIDPDTPKR